MLDRLNVRRNELTAKADVLAAELKKIQAKIDVIDEMIADETPVVESAEAKVITIRN